MNKYMSLLRPWPRWVTLCHSMYTYIMQGVTLKKNHYNFSGQLRADNMPGPPCHVGPMVGPATYVYTLPKHASDKASNNRDVILPHEENHGVTLRCLKQVLIPIMQILQSFPVITGCKLLILIDGTSHFNFRCKHVLLCTDAEPLPKCKVALSITSGQGCS